MPWPMATGRPASQPAWASRWTRCTKKGRREAGGKKSSPSPLRLHLQTLVACRRHAAERVQRLMPSLHDIKKRHAIAACQKPMLSSKARGSISPAS